MAKAKKSKLTIEDALVPVGEQPYEIPENWCWAYLGYTVYINRGSSPRPIKSFLTEDEDGVNWIKIGDTDSGKYINGTKEKITQEGAKKSVPVKKGDLLLTNSMSYGKPFILNIDGCIHDGWFAIEPYECFDKEYLYYSFLASQWYFDKIAVGTAVRNISSDRTATTPLPIPPLAEQRRIVEQIENLFSKLDEAKEKAQSVLDEYETRKQAILYKAFSGGLSNEWRVENNKSIEEWEYKQLGDTNIEIIDGDRGKNYPTKDEFSPEGYCIFLNAKNVTKNGFNFEVLECITKEKDELLHKGRLERGDMIMTTRGTLGNVVIYDETVPYEHLRINSGMVIYRGGEEIYKPYLIWLYKSNMITQQIDRMQTGSAQPQLPIKVMKSLLIPIPSVEEQEVIADCIQSMMDKEEQVKSTIINVIENIDVMKKSVLAKAFRGQLGTNNLVEESSIELLKSILEK